LEQYTALMWQFMTNMSYWQGVNLRYSVSNENTRAYLEINMM